MGAKKDSAKRVAEDRIANKLFAKVGSAGIDPRVVMDTGLGELPKTHGVKKIFHAASVQGQVGIYVCVHNTLESADSPEMDNEDIHSVLFPLMGTGTTTLSLQDVADQLIDTAVSYWKDCPERASMKFIFLPIINRTWNFASTSSFMTSIQNSKRYTIKVTPQMRGVSIHFLSSR